MEKREDKGSLLEQLGLSQNHWTWLLGFIVFFTLMKKGEKKLSLGQIDSRELEKKSRLLNRIKGYMNPQEQHIVHRAEIILHMIGNLKLLLEGPAIHSAGVTLNSMGFEDRKRNMLMDISEFIEDEKREVIHRAIDLDIRVKTLEKQLSQLQGLSQSGIGIENLEGYIDVLEPVLEGEVKERVREIKKLTSLLKLLSSFEKKGQIDEMDVVEAISPFVAPEQRQTIAQMVQIAKAVSTMSTLNEGEKDKENTMVEVNEEEKELFDPIGQKLEEKKE